MTALRQYDRLEAAGLWRDRDDAQRRDVLVSIGKSSLVIRDRADAPLAHWSLAAIERVNPGKRPALFRPGPGSVETLEIEEDVMIEAVEKIRRAIARQGPKRGRLRASIALATFAGLALLATLWLPGALRGHAVATLPDVRREAIGTALLGHVTRLTGPSCGERLGLAALERLSDRVLGTRMRRLHIVPAASGDFLILPGRLLLLDRTLVEDHESPAVLAGHMVAASLVSEQSDALDHLLEFGGIRASLGLLTSGRIDDRLLAEYAETLLRSEASMPDDGALLERFAALGVPSTPFAYARDVTSGAGAVLISRDPLADNPPLLLSDGDWISLQAICDS